MLTLVLTLCWDRERGTDIHTDGHTDILTDQPTRLQEFHMLYGTKNVVGLTRTTQSDRLHFFSNRPYEGHPRRLIYICTYGSLIGLVKFIISLYVFSLETLLCFRMSTMFIYSIVIGVVLLLYFVVKTSPTSFTNQINFMFYVGTI